MEMIYYAALLTAFGIVGLALEVHDRGVRIQALEEEKAALIGRLAACGSEYQNLATQAKPEPRFYVAEFGSRNHSLAAMEGISSGRPIFTDAGGYRWLAESGKGLLRRRKSDQNQR